MKLHICFRFRNSPWGGGNQFLKALKKELIWKSVYEEKREKADVILFNSHHNLESCYEIKRAAPDKIIIHRLDGPISLIRGRDEETDNVIALFNKLFADGIIFQSNWSRSQNKHLFDISSAYETVIPNAVDNESFNKDGKKEYCPKEKIKLIAVSWSSNRRKGFEIYGFLDENLDFAKYEMIFVGNSPIRFKNITYVQPVPSKKLAELLKQQDIYITASRNDPCSNSLIEALSCGLPTVALDSGGHPELVQGGGELFRGKEDVIRKIEKVVQNYKYYQARIRDFSINRVAREYCEFAWKLYSNVHSGCYQPKRINSLTRIKLCKMNWMILRWKTLNKMRAMRAKLWAEQK